ncbi:MAG TPA: class I SAM-dependent methyltransferase [Phenylobacterium sp.]|jgi:hypothetical protein
MSDITVNSFRRRRGAILRKKIEEASAALGRPLVILDVGGRPDYWDNVDPVGVDKIILMNIEAFELSREARFARFETSVGDACDLSAFKDGSIDFVHSNSVIEHVGGWAEQTRMAQEVRRVGRYGWIQTPAWEFPVEPHWRLPIVHWFSRPLQARLLRMRGRFRKSSIADRREIVESVSLLSQREFTSLFPQTSLFVERLALLPKSYTVWW